MRSKSQPSHKLKTLGPLSPKYPSASHVSSPLTRRRYKSRPISNFRREDERRPYSSVRDGTVLSLASTAVDPSRALSPASSSTSIAEPPSHADNRNSSPLTDGIPAPSSPSPMFSSLRRFRASTINWPRLLASPDHRQPISSSRRPRPQTAERVVPTNRKGETRPLVAEEDPTIEFYSAPSSGNG
ncbi:acyl-CoA N-acyltransferases super family protein [Striga asiatica]|uniref:Acyl-CoA N-acyltransferases super family protein n=1 Tax=Striga asiatica TaxID=4170 RepID=A0A5A7QNJ6_STRAF|nr:acyl-CoA N-acyltransferases super family protein [Striga asiatica]